jgi:hypothetical protein
MLFIGWEEHVDLPLLGLTNLRAKIDTGARTSALHATNIETLTKDGVETVRFHTFFNDDAHDNVVESPIHDRREITNTSGVPEERFVIRTKFRIDGKLWRIDLSLADRSGMSFRMIVGRTALRRHKIAVLPGQRNLTSNPTVEKPQKRIQK